MQYFIFTVVKSFQKTSLSVYLPAGKCGLECYVKRVGGLIHPYVAQATLVSSLPKECGHKWSRPVPSAFLNEWISQHFGCAFPLLKRAISPLLLPISFSHPPIFNNLLNSTVRLSLQSRHLVTTTHRDSHSSCKVSIQLEKANGNNKQK